MTSDWTQRLQRNLVPAALVCALAGGLAWSKPVRALEFKGTVWHEVAGRVGVESALLYSLALAESSRHVGAGQRTPWPWVIRTPTGGYWFNSRAAAERGLDAVRAKWPDKRIDVGATQVNLGWHRRRFAEPVRLLDLRYNLRVAAHILADTVDSTRDPVLGIGRYHNWVDRSRSRAYGRRVWSHYRSIAIGDDAARDDYIVATEARLRELVRRFAER